MKLLKRMICLQNCFLLPILTSNLTEHTIFSYFVLKVMTFTFYDANYSRRINKIVFDCL